MATPVSMDWTTGASTIVGEREMLVVGLLGGLAGPPVGEEGAWDMALLWVFVGWLVGWLDGWLGHPWGGHDKV